MREIREDPLFCEVFQKMRQGNWKEAGTLLQNLRAPGISPLKSLGIEYYLGKVKMFAGDLKGAMECFRHALKMAQEEHSEPYLAVYPLCELAFIEFKGGNREQAGAHLSRAEEILENHRHTDCAALFHHYRGIWRNRMNQAREGLQDLKRSLTLYQEEDSPENAAMVNDSLGQFHFEKGELEDAIINFEESMRIKQDMGDFFGLALTWGNLGRAYLLMSDYDRALHYFEKDLQFSEKASDRFGQMVMRNNIGRTLVPMGKIDEGVSSLQTSLELAREQENRFWILLSTKDLARAEIEKGDAARSMSLLEPLLPDIERTGDIRLKSEALGIMSLCYQKGGDREAAQKACREAVQMLSGADAPFELITMKMQLGKLLFENGEHCRALEIFGKALENAEALRAPWLIRKFEALIKNVDENEWIRVRLGRYLGREVIDEILQGVEKATMGGKRQKVTVLVSDIRGYTKFSEDRNPEEIVVMLNDYFSMMVEVIHRFKGTIDKFIGDAILSYFGAPVTYGDDSERALRTASGMMNALLKYNRLRLQRNEEPLEMGIGIETGEAVVGNIGSYWRKDYTVVGRTVTRAFQLCSSAPAGEIHLGAATFEENRIGLLRDRTNAIEVDGEEVFQFLWRQGE